MDRKRAIRKRRQRDMNAGHSRIILEQDEDSLPVRLSFAYPSHAIAFGCCHEPNGKKPSFMGTDRRRFLYQLIF